MSLVMAKPKPHPVTRIYELRVIVPTDLRAKAKGERLSVTVAGALRPVTVGTHVKVSLSTKDEAEAKRRFTLAMGEIETFWQVLRNGPITLGTTQRRAIAGDVYRRLIAENRDEPGEAAKWATNRELLERYMAPDIATDQRDNALDLLAGGAADQALSDRGLRITAESRRDLLHDVGMAMRDAFGNVEAMARIDYSERAYPVWDGPAPAAIPAADPISFKSIIDAVEKDRSRGRDAKPLAASTATKYRREAKSLTDHVGCTDALTITSSQIDGWKNHLQDEGMLANRTIGNAITNMRTVWAWGRRIHKDRFPVVNPFDNVERPSFAELPTYERTFTTAEAKSILNASVKSSNPEIRWLPWLCLFSGARISEASSLRKEDFFEAHERPFYKITATGGRSLKTLSSERRLPIHQRMIDDGFMKWVASRPFGPLFVKRAHQNVGKWVRETVKVTRPEVWPNHGWRHFFEDMLTDAEVDSDTRAYMTGRSTGSSRDKYGRSDVMLPALVRAMDKLKGL